MSEPKIPGGYYIKARKIQESAISRQPPHVREIWDYLLREANHSDQAYRGYFIKRGQLFRTLGEIREALSWQVGWRKQKYNENQTKKAMKFLREALMITTRKEPGGVMITVLNYDLYQCPANYERTKEGTSERTIDEPMKNQTAPYNKKEEELEEIKEEYILSENSDHTQEQNGNETPRDRTPSQGARTPSHRDREGLLGAVPSGSAGLPERDSGEERNSASGANVNGSDKLYHDLAQGQPNEELEQSGNGAMGFEQEGEDGAGHGIQAGRGRNGQGYQGSIGGGHEGLHEETVQGAGNAYGQRGESDLESGARELAFESEGAIAAGGGSRKGEFSASQRDKLGMGGAQVPMSVNRRAGEAGGGSRESIRSQCESIGHNQRMGDAPRRGISEAGRGTAGGGPGGAHPSSGGIPQNISQTGSRVSAEGKQGHAAAGGEPEGNYSRPKSLHGASSENRTRGGQVNDQRRNGSDVIQADSGPRKNLSLSASIDNVLPPTSGTGDDSGNLEQCVIGGDGGRGTVSPRGNVKELEKSGGQVNDNLETPTSDPVKPAAKTEEGPRYRTRKKRWLKGARLDVFEQFWKIFDDKRSKAAAADSWFDLEDYSPDLVKAILHGARMYAQDRQDILLSKGTPKMAQGWLTDRRWEDYVADDGERKGDGEIDVQARIKEAKERSRKIKEEEARNGKVIQPPALAIVGKNSGADTHSEGHGFANPALQRLFG